MNVEAYLERIGLKRPDISADLDSLKLLQRSHLLTVPFENLDIHWKRPIVLDLDRFYQKIVEERRGGFCYELNGLFCELLKNLEFECTMISGRVYSGVGYGSVNEPMAGFGPPFDHMAIVVRLNDVRYLVDVGFGSFAAEPLRLILGEVQNDRNSKFIIRKYDDFYYEVSNLDSERIEYIFSIFEHELAEFAEMCDFQQYSPQSHFTKGKLCSIMSANGRKTLTDTKFIVTSGDEKREFQIESTEDFNERLDREFGIRL